MSLPPPRALPQVVEPPLPMLPPTFIRPNRYDVWQNYAVDRQGRFRPVVIGSAHGSYYLHNGKPFPFSSLHSLNWLPYIAY
jgi:hypothetical protein